MNAEQTTTVGDGAPDTEAPEVNLPALSLLSVRFGAPVYALYHEVNCTTGYTSERRYRADAVAIGLWPSRGLLLHGFEIKASRADWLTELRNPAKSDWLVRQCDRFWLVAMDAKIVQPSELPPNWGLLVRHGKGLRTAVDAPKLTPEPLSRDLLAAIAQRAVRESARALQAARMPTESVKRAAFSEGYDEAVKRTQGAIDRAGSELRKAIDEFEAASGVRIERWTAGRVGAAVRLVLDGQSLRLEEHLRQMRERVRAIGRAIDAAIEPGLVGGGSGGLT